MGRASLSNRHESLYPAKAGSRLFGSLFRDGLLLSPFAKRSARTFSSEVWRAVRNDPLCEYSTALSVGKPRWSWRREAVLEEAARLPHAVWIMNSRETRVQV